MKKHIKYSLLTLGVILLILSIFFPSHGINFSRVSDTPDIVFQGLTSPAWIIISVSTVLLFGVGFFFNSLVMKIVYYSLFGILTAFIAFMIKMMISPFLNSYTTVFYSGFYLIMTTYVVVNSATIISLHRPYVKKNNVNTDLLDS